jgi:large subunit ribosomal protein L2
MPIKSYRPTTPTRRFQTTVLRDEITRQRPEKSLVEGKSGTGGRRSTGEISIRFRGGGHKGAIEALISSATRPAFRPK